MLKKTFAGIALATALFAGSAFAETFEKYGEVEGWNVFIDHSKKSCMIEKSDDVGHVVQMGLTRNREVGYLGVFRSGEADIVSGEKRDVAILIGDNIYTGKSTGMRGNITEGYSGGYVVSDNPQFVKDIREQYTMTVFPNQKYTFTVDLTGTYKAIDLGRKCNAEQLN